MDLKKYFSYESELIPIEDIMKLSEEDLSDLYTMGDEVDGFNVFFIYCIISVI